MCVRAYAAYTNKSCHLTQVGITALLPPLYVPVQAPTVDVSTTAPVDSYTVTFQLESGEAAGGMQDVDSSTLTHTLEGLGKGTRYSVAVVAVNTVGPGEARSAVIVETFVDGEWGSAREATCSGW